MSSNSKRIDRIKELIKVLPNKPGVYQYFNENNKIIYIGKAKDLRKRVSSYFSGKVHPNNKINVLIKKTFDIKHIVVESETDALLLENNLIKKYQPRYNVDLKDDKTFPWINIKDERFPRLVKTRSLTNNGDNFFGPYTSVVMVNELLGLIKKLYKLRTCNYALTEENIHNKKFKVCLEYHIGNCKAPCIGEQNEEEYMEGISGIREILKGNTTDVIKYLKKLMINYADKRLYEDANIIKEKIILIEKYQNKSTIVNSSISNVDVYSIAQSDNGGYVNFIKVVNGGIVQANTLQVKKKLDETLKELLLYAIVDIRKKVKSNSKEILVPFSIDSEFDDVKFIVPKIGDKKKLLDLSYRNAKYYMREQLKQYESKTNENKIESILKAIKKDLRLKDLPEFIECFDNSNIQGKSPVASCVVFKNGKPLKKEYRHFNIKTVDGIDDYASMKEVITRRYKRVIEENKNLPQLLIVDGGKGQLNAALEAIEDLGIRGKISIIGIAKRLEEIYFPGDSVPIYLDKNAHTLKVIQHLRNEAHRFAITFHRQKRSKNMIGSELDSIKGIGGATKNLLLSELKDINGIKKADFNKLSELVGKSKAKILVNHFH